MIKVTENACPFAQNTLGSHALNTMIKAELKKKMFKTFSKCCKCVRQPNYKYVNDHREHTRHL